MNNNKRKYFENEIQRIWESWDWHFQDKLEQLDHMTRCIIREMAMMGIPSEMWQPFMVSRLSEGIEACEPKEVAKSAGRKPVIPSSIAALRRVRAQAKASNAQK